MWLPQSFTSEQRFEMAREITALLLEKYGKRLLGVTLDGSAAKGLDRPQSDIELSVVLEDGEERWYPFIRRGMFVGISYGSLDSELEAADSVDYTWPVAGDALLAGRVLYDPQGIYPQIRERVGAAMIKADFAKLEREALADMYECVLKVYSLEDYQVLTAAENAAGAARWAAITVALANRHSYRSTRQMFEESFDLKNLPQGYRGGIEGLLTQCPDVARYQAVLGKLWPAFTAWAAERGVSLEDEGRDV